VSALMVMLFMISLLASITPHEELGHCETLVERELPCAARCFYSGLWLATCQLAGEQVRTRVRDTETSALVALPSRRR
jgi:hypothetical protein